MKDCLVLIKYELITDELITYGVQSSTKIAQHQVLAHVKRGIGKKILILMELKDSEFMPYIVVSLLSS